MTAAKRCAKGSCGSFAACREREEIGELWLRSVVECVVGG